MRFVSSLFWTYFLCIATCGQAWSQIPPGYYDDAEGLTGDALRQALKDIIDDHTVVDNTAIWFHFQQIDQKPNGEVWDIYSDAPGGTPPYTYNFGADQCGNYDGEGDCFNREHAFPQSWYDDAPPMSTDLFHIYPTDGFVNGMRSNNPFGEVGIASFFSQNGSKLGNCTFPGFNGIVFEPIDAYKGDLARSYFYMLTRYADQVDGWESAMVQGDDLSVWSKNLLLEWAEADPVSQKEVDRNEGIYAIQGNRNPYIDHPEFVIYVWDEMSVGTEETAEQHFNIWVGNRTLHIQGNNSGQLSVQITNSTGQVVYQEASTTADIRLPHSIVSGVYVVKVQSSNGAVTERIFVGP